ncbi:NAD(P)-dependent oxidoreductase [Sphingomonas sp. RIT328]|uniref:NAD(P)-dependent oxidoreductase n=1 Tax=Sphingomonas sp. RIT328 TaxID=1470591 RepID=UPI000448197C|nr:NAD(P)-dependent oxidoreductase [Sphingomonas sp. RIT328]EZP50010.1 NAD binding domain of 6-phosphogluconate dehydrogenase family protein [Sphingomonas sp. RIT328]
MDVGFVGLGAMGGAMAANLVKAGHRVRAWNRSGDPSIDGLEMVATPREAFQGDAVLTMLSDDAAIREVLLDGRVLDGARGNLIHVVTSTISTAFAGELAEIHERIGLGYVSAPVLGRPDVAREGQLNILTGGAQDVVARVRPLLEVLGKKVWHMGDDPRHANAAKIAANMMITMAIEALAEAVVLTESAGLSRDAFFDLILNTLFGCRSYQSYSAHIAQDSYEPGFKAILGLKDLRLATEIARGAGRRLPVLDAVRERMRDAVEAGMGERDWSAMADFTINHA